MDSSSRPACVGRAQTPRRPYLLLPKAGKGSLDSIGAIGRPIAAKAQQSYHLPTISHSAESGRSSIALPQPLTHEVFHVRNPLRFKRRVNRADTTARRLSASCLLQPPGSVQITGGTPLCRKDNIVFWPPVDHECPSLRRIEWESHGLRRPRIRCEGASLRYRMSVRGRVQSRGSLHSFWPRLCSLSRQRLPRVKCLQDPWCLRSCRHFMCSYVRHRLPSGHGLCTSRRLPPWPLRPMRCYICRRLQSVNWLPHREALQFEQRTVRGEPLVAETAARPRSLARAALATALTALPLYLSLHEFWTSSASSWSISGIARP